MSPYGSEAPLEVAGASEPDYMAYFHGLAPA